MIGQLRLWIACGVLVAGSLGASSAYAQMGGVGGYAGGGSLGLGFYNYGSGSAWGSLPNLPYYALYPPVYYSYPVPRPYGYSPFAYPPGVMTPQPTMPTTSPVVHHPFVRQTGEEKPALDRSASMPRTYLNPFVKQAASKIAKAK